MSNSEPSQFYPALKWTWVIIVAAMAINNIAPNVIPHYYFIKKDLAVFRGNTLTGRCERLVIDVDNSKAYWLDITK